MTPHDASFHQLRTSHVRHSTNYARHTYVIPPTTHVTRTSSSSGLHQLRTCACLISSLVSCRCFRSCNHCKNMDAFSLNSICHISLSLYTFDPNYCIFGTTMHEKRCHPTDHRDNDPLEVYSSCFDKIRKRKGEYVDVDICFSNSCADCSKLYICYLYYFDALCDEQTDPIPKNNHTHSKNAQLHFGRIRISTTLFF